MDWYDIVMVTVLGGATLIGAWKGMAWQLASLGSLILSYFLALKFSAQLAPMFGTTAPWNRFVAMLVIYLATSLVVWLAFRLVSGFLDRIKLHGFDHQVGGLFGFVKGLLLCLAITFFALGLAPDLREHIIGTRSGHYISLFLAKADAVMPPEIHQVVDPYLDKLQERLNPQEPFQPNAPLPIPGEGGSPANGIAPGFNQPRAMEIDSTQPTNAYSNPYQYSSPPAQINAAPNPQQAAWPTYDPTR